MGKNSDRRANDRKDCKVKRTEAPAQGHRGVTPKKERRVPKYLQQSDDYESPSRSPFPT